MNMIRLFLHMTLRAFDLLYGVLQMFFQNFLLNMIKIMNVNLNIWKFDGIKQSYVKFSILH